MVLTDRQRADLHAGIFEYLCSRGFHKAAVALKEADPEACERHSGLLETNGRINNNNASSSSTPLLEKKWTAIPRLQKKVLELEKQVANSAKIHAHRLNESVDGGPRRMLPRLPATHTLAGHSMVVTCCAVHPVFTIAVSGSEDGTIKVC
jgi:platelet-activating factor acetylhydrolase IB subunit alpha